VTNVGDVNLAATAATTTRTTSHARVETAGTATVVTTAANTGTATETAASSSTARRSEARLGLAILSTVNNPASSRCQIPRY